MKAYLENNVVSAIGKDDTASESDSRDRLLVAYNEGKVNLVTCELALSEMKSYIGTGRKRAERSARTGILAAAF